MYVWPFASMLYPVWYYIYTYKYDEYIVSQEWTFVSLGSIVTLHALSFLVCQWSVSIKALFTCVKVISYIKRVMNYITMDTWKEEICGYHYFFFFSFGKGTHSNDIPMVGFLILVFYHSSSFRNRTYKKQQSLKLFHSVIKVLVPYVKFIMARQVFLLFFI